MIQTLKSWIETIFKSEGAWRTWAIVAASVVLIVLLLWFLQAVLGWNIGAIVQGWMPA